MPIGIGTNGSMQVGGVKVQTTTNTGLSVEYWTDRLLDRIVHIAGNSDSIIKEQALVFKDGIRGEIIRHLSHAIMSDRTTLYNLFIQQGEGEMAEILRRLR